MSARTSHSDKIFLFAIKHSGVESTFLEVAVRAGEISRNYDDVMSAFRDAFFAKDTVAMDYIEQVCCALLRVWWCSFQLLFLLARGLQEVYRSKRCRSVYFTFDLLLICLYSSLKSSFR